MGQFDLWVVGQFEQAAFLTLSAVAVTLAGMPVPESLETARLTLVPFTVAFIQALGHQGAAQKMIGAEIPADWPDNELAELLELYAKWTTDGPEIVGYGPWVIIIRSESVVVGSAGFQGVPADDGSIELGFGIHADYRSRGYATEAALALVEWGLSQPAVGRVVAHCEADNTPSVRVLERVGMKRVKESEGNIAWQAAPSSWEA